MSGSGPELTREVTAMSPEFWIVLDETPNEELANRVYEAGFDDAIVTTAAGSPTIEIRHRQGELHELIREAISQSESAGLTVRQVVIPRAAFPVG